MARNSEPSKIETPTPILTLAQIIFHIDEYIASNFEFVSFWTPRKIHLKKCIFTFSENVTNYSFTVGVHVTVTEERKNMRSSIHLKGQRTCVMWM